MILKMLAGLLPLCLFYGIAQILHLLPAEKKTGCLCLGRDKTGCGRLHQIRIMGTADKQRIEQIEGKRRTALCRDFSRIEQRLDGVVGLPAHGCLFTKCPILWK